MLYSTLHCFFFVIVIVYHHHHHHYHLALICDWLVFNKLLKRKQISLSYVNSTNLFEILFKVKTVKLFPFPLKTLHKSAKLMQTHVVPVLQHWTW